jgi:S-adenosylmethionine:tRNA ribosyltransferase-isomerase
LISKELLAEFPSEHRDEARLMVIDRKKQTIEHKTFKDVIDYFDDGDVLNNTKVFPRLYGNKEKQEQESKFFYLEN